MPTYPTTSPSGRVFDIDAASEDEAKQVAAQRFFHGLEPPEAPQSKPSIASFFSPFQNDLAKQIAAKRTGDPDATPTAADYYHVANSQAQNEQEYSAYEQQQREMLIKRQREQARLNSIWEEDMPRQPLEDEPLLQPSSAPQQQQGPWSITNRMTAASALRGSRYRRALAALTSRNTRYPR